MNKENTLFGIVGLLLGLIIGFFFANSINQGAVAVSTIGNGAAQQTAGALPAGHPAVQNASGNNGPVPEVQAAIENAKQNPKDFEAQLKAAELYYQIQRYDGAIEYLQKAHDLQPDNLAVVSELGNVNFDADKYEEAEKWYSQSLAAKPDNLDVRTDMGLTFVFRDKPNYDRAIQEFKRVLDSDPNHVQALQNLTVAYTKKSDKANAKATLDRLEAVDPSNKAITQLRADIQKL